MTDQQQTSPYSGQPLVDWADHRITLRDADGDKIGDLVEINPDFLIAESDGGFLGLGEHRQYYVPRRYVSREDDEDWYLTLSKDQVESQDWLQPPADSGYAGGDWRQQYETATTTATQGGDSPDENVAQADQVTDRADRTRLVAHEERLQARPVPQQAGEAQIRKEVVEENQTIEVPVRREEIVIERRPASDASADTGVIGAESDTVRIPIMEEQVEVSKVVRPVEEVEVSKRVVEDTETVSDTVRREEIRVEGDDRVREAGQVSS